MSIGNQK